MKNNIIKSLENLAAYEASKREKGYQFKIAMYRRAIKSFKLKNSPKNFSEAQNILRNVFKNPGAIELKIKELFETGKISAVNKARNDPVSKAITLLSSVPQIGPVKAKQLVTEHEIFTITQLQKNKHLLNDKQKLGLKYYNELIDPETLDAVRIPRKEIDRFEILLKKYISKDLEYKICGSYRRGAKASGDIDTLFTGSKEAFKKLVSALENDNVIKDPFSSGTSKWMGMGKIDKLHRRIDLMYIKPEEYPFALLYFTGSQEFNEALRGYCRKLGYTLNEHGLKSLSNMKQVDYEFKTEKDIFKFLKVEYIDPINRNQGKFVLPKIATNVSIKSSNNFPKDLIQCLKGKGTGGFSIGEIRNVAKIKGIDHTGTKKEICNRLFKTNKNETKYTSKFNVSKGVLLANTYKNTNPVGMMASEKFDGVRAIWDGVKLKSRTDKDIHAPKWYLNFLPIDMALDGELYLKRGSFEETTSIVSKKIPVNEEWKKIKYMIFDAPSLNEPFTQRLQIVNNYVKMQCENAKNMCSLRTVDHVQINSINQMKAMFNNIIKKGGEGIMLRVANSKYEQKRSKTLLKVKPTDDAEAIITNMIEGKGKDVGTMGALKVKLQKNPAIEFKIGTGFTSNLRKMFWNKKNNYIGNVVTFGYKGLTTKGIPRHPSFMRLRSDKNM